MKENRDQYISKRIPVPSEFGEVFSHFYVTENNTPESIQKTLLPSFQMILVFSFGEGVPFTSSEDTTIETGKCILLGPIKQPINYLLPTGAELLVINFKEDAFYRFFGQAVLSEHMSVHPDKLLDENCFTDLWYQLKNIGSPTERIHYILDFCQPYLGDRDFILKQISNFDEDSPLSPVKEIARKTNKSERLIQQKHKKYLGYSAKEINRYQRFVKTIRLLEDAASSNAARVDWSDIISQCGYYDQSHLIRDFNHFLNLSPTKYLKFQQDICMANPV